MDTRPVLSLTLLSRTVPAGPPAVHAFLAGARTSDPEAQDPLLWLLPDAPEQVQGLSMRLRAGPLPAPEVAPATPDLRRWELEEAGFWSRHRAGAARALASLTAAVPLALAPALGLAQGAPPEPAEEAAEPDDDDARGLAGLREAAGKDDLSTAGMRLWWALDGARVELTLTDGTKLFGRVLAQVEGEVALVLDQDGFVMRVPKDTVMRVRVLDLGPGGAPAAAVAEAFAGPAPDWAPPTGKAPLVLGAILTSAGGGLMTVWAVGAAADSSFGYYMAPMMVVGATLVGPGIPILVTGLVQQKSHARWAGEHATPQPELEVGMAPARAGWSGSLTVRF